MTFDDHWADTQIRLRQWASNFGFIDEGDDEEGFRFVLDKSTTPTLAASLGEIISDLNLKEGDALVKRNLLVYFIAVLDGQLVISMPQHGLNFCSADAGKPETFRLDSQHRDKEKLWAKYQYDTEELILGLFENQLNDCRRAHIKEVKS